MNYQPKRFNPMDVTTWQYFNPLIIAHDVGRSRDRSTAVIGGPPPHVFPMQPPLIGISELIELPQGLFGSARASALAAVDTRYHNNALIVADLSNDASYAEILYRTFGPRIIGLHITRHGNGMSAETRPVSDGYISVYTIGRAYLLEQFHNLIISDQIRAPNNDMWRRAFAQLEALQPEWREGGPVYSCPNGQHDDLGISCAMLAWLARHPHLQHWVRVVARSRRPPPAYNPPSKIAWC